MNLLIKGELFKMENDKNITIFGAKLIFRNFQGKVSAYNKNGEKNVGILLPDDIAEKATADGWNVKYLKPREDDPEQYRQPYLLVKVSYKFYPPEIYINTSRGKTIQTEQSIAKLDWANIQNVDVTIRPYHYPSVNGQPAGISAYVKSMVVTLEEDDVLKKYADVPDIGALPYEM